MAFYNCVTHVRQLENVHLAIQLSVKIEPNNSENEKFIFHKLPNKYPTAFLLKFR